MIAVDNVDNIVEGVRGNADADCGDQNWDYWD